MEIAIGTKPWSPQSGLVDAHIAEAIAPGVELLAVAQGFGAVRGRNTPDAALSKLRDLLRRSHANRGNWQTALTDALSQVNAHIFARSGNGADRVGAGTSLTAALTAGGTAMVAHVGRTRAYVQRDDRLLPLTADDEIDNSHWLQPRTNVPTEALARHLLTRSLGTQPTLEMSVGAFRLLHGDVLILATSVFHAIAGDPIRHAARNGESSEDIVQRLLQTPSVQAARESGTVVVARALAAASPQNEGSDAGIVYRPAELGVAVALLVLLVGLLLGKFW